MVNIIFIILNYKSYSDTIILADELLRFNLNDYRVLIVDNKSPNESFSELYSYYWGNNKVDVIQSNENGGFAKGNNYGLKYASRYNPQYVCLINNDVHFTQETIIELEKKYNELSRPAIIAPKQVLPNGELFKYKTFKLPSFLDDLRYYTHWPTKPIGYGENCNIPNIQKVEEVPGAFMFAKYNILETIGFFDESTFLFGEERFLGKAVKDNGLSNYIVLNITYLHQHSKTINSEVSKKFQRKCLFNSMVAYTKKYRKYSRVKIFLLAVLFYYTEFKMSVKRLLNI